MDKKHTPNTSNDLPLVTLYFLWDYLTFRKNQVFGDIGASFLVIPFSMCMRAGMLVCLCVCLCPMRSREKRW